MSTDQSRGGRSSVPPRWVYRALWALHRAGYAISGGRLGLRAAVERQGLCEQYAAKTEREIPIVILEPSNREADA